MRMQSTARFLSAAVIILLGSTLISGQTVIKSDWPKERFPPMSPGQDIQTAGSYGAEGYIYQAMAPPKTFDDKHAVLGCWVIRHEEGSAAGGMGIRESDTPVIGNLSQFVPHLFD